MITEAETNKIRDEVYRKIGRNILFIQGIEQKLKNLIAINGSRINSKSKTLDQRLADVSKKTMGNLAGEFYEVYFIDQNQKSQKGVEPIEPIYSFRLERNAFATHMRKSLASIVEERNMLVHHFLQKLDVSKKSWEEADNRLEQQHKGLVATHESLNEFSSWLREIMLKDPSDISNKVSDKAPEELS